MKDAQQDDQARLAVTAEDWTRLMAAIESVRRQRTLVTYRALIERVGFTAPAMQRLAVALEHLAMLDAKANRPLRSALVVSQGVVRIPRPGFFECAERLGRYAGAYEGEAAAAWHALEIAQVFSFEY